MKKQIKANAPLNPAGMTKQEQFSSAFSNALPLTNPLPAYTQNGTISLEDARKMYEDMEKQILLSSYSFPQEPSSDGYYHIYVKDPTKKSGRRAVKSKTLDLLAEKVYQHERGIHGRAKKTFRDVFNLVQEEKLRYVKDEDKRLSVLNTIGRNRSEYHRFFSDTEFEKKYIDEISKTDVERLTLANLQRYDLTKKGFLSYRGILKSVFKMAFEEYMIADNVYDRVNFRKYNDMLVRPAAVSSRMHSDDELERILACIREKHLQKPKYLPAYALELQIVMGLRRGEVPPLMWSDILDGYILISKEQITVKKSTDNPKEYFRIVNHTKTWKDRKFPITEEIRDILEQIRLAHQKAGIDSEYLFPAKSANGVITNNTVYNYYRRICKKLDIAISRDCIKGTHSFRRNAITKAVNRSGGNILMASQLFGNTPDVAENNYYTGLDLDEAKNILET